MAPLGLVENGTLRPHALPETTPEIELSIEDTLASASRLWIRGRLAGVIPAVLSALHHGHNIGRALLLDASRCRC